MIFPTGWCDDLLYEEALAQSKATVFDQQIAVLHFLELGYLDLLGGSERNSSDVPTIAKLDS